MLKGVKHIGKMSLTEIRIEWDDGNFLVLTPVPRAGVYNEPGVALNWEKKGRPVNLNKYGFVIPFDAEGLLTLIEKYMQFLRDNGYLKGKA